MLQKLFTDYISAYAAKDIDAIGEMFADDILLRDWKISVSGKDRALQETAINFANAQTISIDVLQTYASDSGVAGELKIVVNHTEILYVTDVIQFNDEAKISAIRAYIGRAD
ncbi:nuclear transport factor 2 family protein [Reinekea sp. G2M2-21]|uniref:nuclear transport factor 2 family protein n=1 Tax=Reinekea sp. G2M2-21 TaxID=2788942 RepID=UPI0018ABEFE2|nr:nuclear transport factor 2 family protein [Reinekea sp. G2M2-21]